MLRRTLFIASIVVPTLLAISYRQLALEAEYTYDRGKEILASEGPGAAAAFFDDRSVATGDQLALFGSAWAVYLEGRKDVAEATCWFLISDTDDPIIRAHCNYLMGFLMTDEGKFDRAFNHFSLAKNIYAAYEQPERVYKALLGVANTAVMNRDGEEAAEYLQQARELRETGGYDPSFYFVVEKKLAHLLGDFEKAVAWCEVIYEVATEKNNKHERLSALGDLAFHLLLIGNHTRALSLLDEARALQEEIDSPVDEQFLNVSRILFNRCNGLPYDHLTNIVEAWIAEDPRPELESALKLAQTRPCREQRGKED